MSKELIFLGIESSCDETAASIVKEDKNGKVHILSNVVSSQVKEHKPLAEWFQSWLQDLMLKKLIQS